MDAIFTVESLLALLSLVGLEIVLGIDNIVFIAIVAGKLPLEQRESARIVGLSLAVITRILLLMALAWFMAIQSIGFTIYGHTVSIRDLVLLFGGLFLMFKATHEIHSKIDHDEQDKHGDSGNIKHKGFWPVIMQILMIDLIFSIDSVLTAVGMVKQIEIMITAVIISVGIMLLCSKVVVDFIENHPTVKMLALSFLLMIGLLLVAESFHQEFNKGYVYFAMAFSLGVEFLNIKERKKRLKNNDVAV